VWGAPKSLDAGTGTKRPSETVGSQGTCISESIRLILEGRPSFKRK